MQWFASYLSNRRQSVIIGNTNSKSLGVSHGVPQGSVLDFYRCRQFFNFHIFADDTNLFASHNSLQILEKNINENQIYVSNWLTATKLSLNIDKTNFVLFQPPQKATNNNIGLVINDQFIKKAKCIKYLGILIDSQLSWKQQILHIFLHNALFMYDFYSDCLPSVFNCFFLPVNRIH